VIKKERTVIMAHFVKYSRNVTNSEITNHCNHNSRIFTSEKPNINTELSKYNYVLSSHGTTAEELLNYYKERTSQVYIYGKNRQDRVTLCEWVVTAPHDLKKSDEHLFFESVHEFMCNKYSNGNENNILLSSIHHDETTAHEHILIIPITKNSKYFQNNTRLTECAKYPEKLSANDIFTKNHLSNFHKELSDFINKEKGIKCTLYSTGSKKDLQREIEKLSFEKEKLQDRVSELEKTIEKQHEHKSSWGNSRGWSKERSKTWEREL
jgi:hypothetical protein